MVIRRNSKEFIAVEQVVKETLNGPGKNDTIKLYNVPGGNSLDKRIELKNKKSGLDELYFTMAKENLLSIFDSKDHTLYRSDTEPNLYYFSKSTSKEFVEAVFELSGKLIAKIQSLALSKDLKVKKNKKEPDKAKTKETLQREPITKKGKVKVAKKSVLKVTAEKRDDEKEKRINVPIIKEEEPQPDIKLKHVYHFHNIRKIVFSDLQLSKEDLLYFYNDISDTVMKYLIDRPQFFRWHRGTIRESEYNKSLKGLKEKWKGTIPEWVQTTKVYAKKYDEETDYMLCTDKDPLLFLIDMGCIELSPWHSRVKSIDKPDYIIIDLDPVEIEFKYVVEVAQAAKEILDGCKLPSFIKTSGSKGLHINISLDAKTDYDKSRALCEFLCKLIHYKIPNLTSLIRDPHQRRKKVYLDAFQNSMAKSIASPYCIRPNERGGVATPLYWEEVNEKLNIKEFNYQTIFQRLKEKGDPFENLLKKKVNSEQVLQGLNDLYGFLF